LSQSTRVTDRRTDRQNYDSQDRPRICSRGKNWTVWYIERYFTSTYMGVTNFQKTVWFLAHPVCCW